MNLHPILFNDEMVRAILEGRKTQTRRPIKPPVDGLAFTGWHPEDMSIALFAREDEVGKTHWSSRCPYGIPGDRLWVRETWQLLVTCAVGWGDGPDDWDYDVEEAEGIPKQLPYDGEVVYRATDPEAATWWHPSIHMPRWASRIDLEVTDVRVQRLRDIEWRDVKAEGIDLSSLVSRGRNRDIDAGHLFAEQWDAIYADRGLGWNANPWV